MCHNKLLMLNVYETIIRPNIEYAVQVWNIAAAHGNWMSNDCLHDL